MSEAWLLQLTAELLVLPRLFRVPLGGGDWITARQRYIFMINDGRTRRLP